MDTYRGLDTVLVKRNEVLDKLRENRDIHAEQYVQARAGWEQAVVDGLKDALAKAESKTEFVTSLDLPQPTDHTSDYDSTIAMLSMSQDDLLELGASEFNQYVMDNWRWKEQFTRMSQSYTKSR